ncbi:MAG: hypothetical protein OSJ45_02410 [Lachnospiraceae bacterium]|nr:hypothetical protein [Lachnospiraceae bacterium]
MNISITKCIRELNRNRNVEELLPEYVKQSRNYYGSHACFKLALEYFMFFENISEEAGPLSGDEEKILKDINSIIGRFFNGMPGREECKGLAEELLALRKEITGRMQVVSAYIDCFSVYEYILNRIEYRFAEKEEEVPDDIQFTEDVVQFIFSSKDNAAINEKVRFVTGQLPMRMLRSKYFDIIRESVSIYKGNDLSSLEGFEYMFRTNAMLYKDENMDIYFTEFKKNLGRLKEADFENIDRKQYKVYNDIEEESTYELLKLSDLYILFGEITNLAYTVAAAAAYTEEADRVQDKTLGVAAAIIKGINELFTDKETDIWELAEEPPVLKEDKFSWLSELLDELTGKQETISEILDMSEAALGQITEVHSEAIESLGLAQDFDLLLRLSLLNSNSTFAELGIGMEDGKDSAEVTQQIADSVAGNLISEVKELFKGSSRILRRAIMANTLEKIPVFFNTPQEVADYISVSLLQCDDEAEKYASKKIIMDEIEEYSMFQQIEDDEE